MSSLHDGHRQRMKREFLARPNSFPDHKVLELLLFYANPRSDTNPLAHDLLNSFGSIAGLLDAQPDSLLKQDGVGEHTVVLLKAVKEMAGRYLTARTSMDGLVTTADAAYERLRPYFFGARVEHVVVLCLDAKGKELGIREITRGNVNAAEISTRDVLETALSLNAAQIVLAHNHVSGIALPSDADKSTTCYLSGLLKAVGISLFDHLIFVDEDMVSMRESGLRF